MKETEDEIFNRQRPIAFKIAKEAVEAANIPLLSDNDFNFIFDFINERWRIFYREENQDIALTIQLNPNPTKAIVHLSLGLIAWGILQEVENLLSNPDAMEMLAVKENEREDEIYNKTLRLTKDYINYLPIVMFHSFHQALNETIISHIKKFVDYDMRHHLDQTDKPDKKFTLLPNNSLNDIRKLFPAIEFDLIHSLGMINEEFSVYRKAAFRDRQVWLTPIAFAKLPAHYEQLKLEYKNARSSYKVEQKLLKPISRRSTFEEVWKKHWEVFCDENFPNLYFPEEVLVHSASELAFRQLGEIFGISESYMEILVGNARQQAKRAGRINKKADNIM